MSSGTFYAEIRTGGARLTLGTFDTVEQAVRAYDAAAWRLRRPCKQLNFKNCEPLAEAEFLSGFDSLVTAEQRRRRQQLQCHLAIAKVDERAMKATAAAFPQDVLDERAFYAQKNTKRMMEKENERIHARKRFIKAQEAGQTTIDEKDERWADLVLTKLSESTGTDYEFSDF
ncbi:uncharacterized protein [Lolium perenne]|uniref:uncharacterized protein n=1 Tax=Lolium perenne TaxID=4522 RepID=UPI003A9A4262